MPLQVFNSLTQSKDIFVPFHPPRVLMYVCGITAYDHCHLGHARAYVTFDLVRRHLEYRGFQVKHVQNITDIDDKIINRAQELKEDSDVLTQRFIQSFSEDMTALNNLPAHAYPAATANLAPMVAMIATLLQKGLAYQRDGDVFFKIQSFGNYGKLSQRTPQQMEAGARVEPDPRKLNPLDFVLWKAHKAGEPAWDSPWGKGRPGWHIECSAMASHTLGPQIDIHGGGRDLIFPHHENEIAQSEAVFDKKPFAKYWLHNGFVTIDRQKMSKSLGNFFTLKDLFKTHDPMALRFYLLMTHYRHPVNFSDSMLADARQGLHRLRQACHENNAAADAGMSSEFTMAFDACLDDDFNSAEALACLFNLGRDVNRQRRGGPLLLSLAARLGLRLLPTAPPEPIDAEIQRLIDRRQAARAVKNYALADEIRNNLQAQNIIMEDTPQGLRWRRAS